MTDRACKNCYFYSPNKEKGAFDKWDGECRRNPPNNGFPGVNEDFWCGEFCEKGLSSEKKKTNVTKTPIGKFEI